MGPEMLALLQHTHVLVPGAPAQKGGCQCPRVLLGTTVWSQPQCRCLTFMDNSISA